MRRWDDNGTPGDPGDDFCANDPGTDCPNGFLDCDFAGHLVDAGDGSLAGDGAYLKPLAGTVPDQGAVYMVAGTAGDVRGGLLNHPVMVSSLNVLGSVVLELDPGIRRLLE